MLSLRGYQQAAITAIYDYFDKHRGNPLVVVPTAGGKSLILSSFIKGAFESWPNERFIVLTHVRELIEQNHAEMLNLWPEAPAGIYSAGLGQRNTKASILFAGIQSVHARAQEIGHCDLVLVDEAHLIPSKSATMYRKFLDEMKAINPDVKVIGFTATPYRLDSGLLHEGKDALFTDIAYEVSVSDLIEQGYLCPLTSKAPATKLDVTGVASRGGDYVASALQSAVDQEAITRAVVSEIITLGAERKSWLAFCAGVDHARHVAEEFKRRGISCATIFGSTPKDERDEIIAAFKRQEIRALASMGVLTTGFNAPAVDLIALLRPTQSAGLYVQMVGRGARLAPSKENCLVLDFAGNVRRHGPIDVVNPTGSTSKKDGAAKTKDCPSCHSILAINASKCPDCGRLFESQGKKEPVLSTTAEALPILSTGQPNFPAWFLVNTIRFSYHEKRGGRPSMKVTYACGLQIFDEWVCFEHEGYARKKAEDWWRRFGGQEPVPTSIKVALLRTNELRTPSRVLVQRSGSYLSVTFQRFDPCAPPPLASAPSAGGNLQGLGLETYTIPLDFTASAPSAAKTASKPGGEL